MFVCLFVCLFVCWLIFSLLGILFYKGIFLCHNVDGAQGNIVFWYVKVALVFVIIASRFFHFVVNGAVLVFCCTNNVHPMVVFHNTHSSILTTCLGVATLFAFRFSISTVQVHESVNAISILTAQLNMSWRWFSSFFNTYEFYSIYRVPNTVKRPIINS